MSKIYALLLLLLVVVACSLRNRRADLFYSFDFQLTMPVQDTFSVGDTIWYEKDLYHLLFDKNNNHFFELKDYTLYFKLLSHKKDSTLVEDATP